MNESIVFLNNIEYGYNKKSTVLKNLFFEIKRGRILGILGHNGAGKTTLLRLLGHLIYPERGSISWAMSDEEKIGIMPEGLGLYPKLTGYDNLKLILLGAQKVADKKSIMEILKDIGLEKYSRKLVGYWSMGMKRRLALTQALLSCPNLLLLDEPFTGIDPLSRKIMVEKMRIALTPMTSIVFTSHDLHLVKEVCNSIIIIRDGEVVFKTEKTHTISDIESIYFEYAGE